MPAPPLSCFSLVFPASPISPGSEPHHFLPFSPAPWPQGQGRGTTEPSLPSSCAVERSSVPPSGSSETQVGNPRVGHGRFLTPGRLPGPEPGPLCSQAPNTQLGTSGLSGGDRYEQE